MDPLESHLNRQINRGVDFFWHRVRWKAVSSYLPSGDRPFTLLDVGAGAGLLGTYLERDRPNARYDFVEPIASLEADLVARFGADHNRASTERLDDVHVMTLLDVIEHVERDEALLADLVARTTPGTMFVVTVPAHQRLWSQWDVLLGHYRRYERDGLCALLERVSLDVVEVAFLFPELVPAAWWRARPRPARVSSGDVASEFPRLPRVVDRSLLALGNVTVRARRFAPTGTSLFAAARR